MSSEAMWHHLEDVVEDIIDRRGVTPLKLGGGFTSCGHRVISAKLVKDGQIRLDADPPRFVDEAIYKKWMRTPLQSGDVILTSEAPLGEVAYLAEDVDWALGQRLFCIRPIADRLDGRFLYYVLQTDKVRADLHGRASGTTVQGIRQTELRRVQVPVPELSIQRAVSEVLGALDDRITLLRETNTTLEAIVQALFKSWFADFDPVRAKMEGRTPEGMDEATAALFPDGFEMAEVGEVPKGWHFAPVYELATYINGAAYKAFEPNTERRGLPIIKIAELKAGITAQTAYSDVDMSSKYRIETGDILFSWSGNPDTSIDTFVWTHEEAWLNQHIFRVLPHSSEKRSFVLQTLRYLRPVFAELARNKQTTGLGHVTVADMKRLLVVRPSRSVLAQFDLVAGPIQQRIFNNARQAQVLSSLRDTLLPRLISGQMRLTDIQTTG